MGLAESLGLNLGRCRPLRDSILLTLLPGTHVPGFHIPPLRG
jgi:hypothetical protein